MQLVQTVAKLEKRIEELENRLNRGSQPGYKGSQQKLLDPTEVHPVFPKKCTCGCSDLLIDSVEQFYTHQHIELPKIEMKILYFILHKGKCKNCGSILKSEVLKEKQCGYGPRLSTFIGELSGTYGNSRIMVQDFCQSFHDLYISTGAIQKIIDRVSASLEPVYDQIEKIARVIDVNFIDETS